MAALTADRNTPEVQGRLGHFPVAAATEIFAGSMVALDGGYAVPAEADPDLVVVGRAEEAVDNSTGQAGDLYVDVKEGVFQFENSADADAITAADIGSDCYAADDQTVAKTYGEVGGVGTRPVARAIKGVDADGVWVRIAL